LAAALMSKGDAATLGRSSSRHAGRAGRNIPSTALIGGVRAIRPCFVGARTETSHADALVDEVIARGDRLAWQAPPRAA
jgi:hypothetical protein